MVATPTNRLGFRKQAGPDPISRTLMNEDLDRMDFGMGGILVNPGGAVPDANNFDGSIIREKGRSGKEWFAEKQPGNTYLLRPIGIQAPRPFLHVASTATSTLSGGSSFGTGGWGGLGLWAASTTFNIQSLDSTDYFERRNFGDGRFNHIEIKKKGMYLVTCHISWPPNVNGDRGIGYGSGGAGPNPFQYILNRSLAGAALDMDQHWMDYSTFNAGDLLTLYAIQTSGTALAPKNVKLGLVYLGGVDT